MNQKVILGILAVVLVGLGIWYVSSPASPSSSTSITTAPAATTPPAQGPAPSTPAKPVGAATPSTFKGIFTQSGNHECKYESIDGSTRISSVIYISGGKMRGEFRTTGVTSSANLMVYMGGYLYSWKEGATIGKKSSIKSLSDLPALIPQDLTSGTILGTSNDNVSWDCHPWATDQKLLTVPTYVKFS